MKYKTTEKNKIENQSIMKTIYIVFARHITCFIFFPKMKC